MGNLVGAPLDEWVQEQIKVRQEVIGDNPGEDRNNIIDLSKRILHNHNKTSWVRLTSSVNIINDKQKVGDFKIPEGDELAKSFVLFGGVNFNPTNTKGGIVPNQTIMNKLLDASNYSYGLGETQTRGYEPIPGIDSVKIRHVNRGAIRKYNITLKAHNKTQFDLIEKIYLRLGYYMLLEWGHTVYIDDNKELKTSPEYNTPAFNDFFEKGKTDNDIVDRIKENRKTTGGNYDGALFLVSNYSWNLEDDGSYNITLEGISKGGLLGSLLLNSSSTKDSNFFNYTFPEINNDERTKILKTLKYTDDDEKKIEIKYQKALGSFLSRGKYQELVNAGAIVESSTNSQSETQQKVIFENDTDDNQTVFLDQKRTNLNKRLFSFNQDLENGEWQNENGLSYKVLKKQKLLRLKLKNPNNNKNAFYYDYIQLGKLLETIKQEYFTQKGTDSDNPSYEIDFSNDNGMFTHWFQHSIDPKVCLIPFEYYDTLESTTKTSPSLNNILSQFDGPFRDKNNPYKGNLMNIFVNLEFIASTLKNVFLPETGEIPFYNFLDEIMYSIQTSLGNINSFYITYTEESDFPSLKIVDDTIIPGTTEPNESNEDYHLRLFGVQPDIEGSFVRNLSTQSKITDKLVTQIAIGSTSTGVNSSTSLLARWNEGLEDRIKTNPNNSNQDQNNEILERIKNTYDNILIFLKDVYENYNNPTSVTTAQTNLQLLLDYDLGIKTLNGNIAGKGFIPIDLSLELEGISGMLLFQKLKVDNLILPDSYVNKIDFIIQAMDHTIQNNEWTTTLSTLSVPKRENLRNNDSNEATIFSRLKTQSLE